MSTIITRNPILAINKAKQLEQRGFIVAMQANGDKLVLTYARIKR